MKILVILGPLGSGKTTLVNNILKGLKDLRILVIVNDVGTENVDAKRIKNADNIKSLTAGCIGCSDLPAFQAVIREAQSIKDHIDLVLIEPTGIADGYEIRDAVVSAGEKFKAITLVDVKHFERNRALGCIENQLKVATVVGITWNNHKDKDIPEYILTFIGEYSPGVKIFQNPSNEINLMMEEIFATNTKPKFSLFIKKEHQHRHDENCNYGCSDDHHTHQGHNHHGHNHDHGVYVYTFKMNSDATYDALVLTLAPYLNILVRAKGVIDGRLFDFVQGDISLGEKSKSNEHPYGNFIFTQKVKKEIFVTISKNENENILSKKERMRSANIPVQATIEAINWQLGLYPPVITPSGILRVDCEADVSYQLAKRKGVPTSIRQKVMQKYVSWRLESSRQLSNFKGNINLPYWKRRLGLNLGYMCAVYPELIGNKLASDVSLIKPAEILAEGLLGLTELSFDEEMAEEKPETVMKVFSSAKTNKDLLKQAVLHCLKLSEKNLAWHTRWKNVL